MAYGHRHQLVVFGHQLVAFGHLIGYFENSKMATNPLQELEGGACGAPNLNLTSQGAQMTPIWWLKATSPPQELERGLRSDLNF